MPKYEFDDNEHKYVYLPDEDSFLLMDSFFNFQPKHNVEHILEIGAGSGVCGCAAAQLFQATVHSTDVNTFAVGMTNKTYSLNNVTGHCTFVNKNQMFPDICQKYDLILFNPPYLPGYETSLGIIDKALSGGLDGTEIVHMFIQKVKQYANESGFTGFLILEARNDVENIKNSLYIQNFTAEIVAFKRLPSEKLFCIKFTNVQ